MIDKELLMSEADALTVAQYLGMEIEKKGAYNFICCPGHEKRLGKADTKISNCVLTAKGYKCFACNASVNLIDMTMEYTGCSYPEALNMIADACGGVKLFEIEGGGKVSVKTLPLSASDLELIGLKPSSQEMPILNASDVEEEGIAAKRDSDDFFLYEKGIHQSLLALYQTDPDAYSELVKRKAKASVEKYEKALQKFCSRDSEGAGEVFELFNENGSITADVFFGLKNAFQKKLWRAKEILEMYE